MIIESNRIVSAELSKHLTRLGFHSFDHVWTEEDAIAVADKRRPDLLLVGDRLETGSPIAAARAICVKHDVPALLVTSDSSKARQRLGEGALLDGPFAFSNISKAVSAAQSNDFMLAAQDRCLAPA